MSLSSQAAREQLAHLVIHSSTTGTKIDDSYLKLLIDRVVAAEFRSLSQDLIAEDNPNVIWRALVQRANELDSPAVNR